ncbi:MAG: T9SS type A sorting domain-containing protein [Saprospiraceae bacterium]|nr:T9SS type A sorting domain-containing protein [Saprospiraceae bacterium]
MKQYTQVSMNTNLHFRVFSILFLTFLLAKANIYAQLPQLPKVPYEPLKFSNVDINWYKTKKDTNRKPPISDGYNCFSPPYLMPGPEPLIYDGYIYSIAYRPNDTVIYDGTYLEKRDIQTGALAWQTFFGYTGLNSRVEYASLIYINDDGQLEIISKLTPIPFDSIKFNFWYRDGLLLTKRVYDVDTGDLMQNIQPNLTETDYFKTDVFFSRDLQKMYREKEGTRILYKSQIKNLGYWAFNYITTVVNPLDKVVIYDTLRSEFGDTDFSFFKLKDDEYLITEHIDSTKQLVFKYVDGKMNVISQVKSESLNWKYLPAIEILEYDEVTKLLLVRNTNVDFETNTISYGFAIMDKSAKVVKKIDVTAEYENIPRVLKWKDGELVVLLDGNSLEILVENNGAFESKTIIPISNERKGFVVSDVIDNGDAYILYLWERAFYWEPSAFSYKIDPYGDAASLISIPKSEFLLTKTKDEEPFFVRLSPNPSNGLIRIEFPSDFTGDCKVTDLTGKTILTRSHFNTKEIQLDLSNFPGMNLVKLTSEKGDTKVFKVIVVN